MERLRNQKNELDRRKEELEKRQQLEQHSRDALEHLERFSRQVTQGLDVMTFEERQQLLQLLVERVTVENGRAVVETIIPGGPDGNLRNPRREPVEPSFQMSAQPLA